MISTNRILIITALTAWMLSACDRQASYSITGTIDIAECEGEIAVLEINDQPQDTVVVTNGKYRFEGHVGQPELGTITIEGKHYIRIEVALDNAAINVHTDTEGWNSVSGTPDNDRLQQFNEAKRTPEAKLRKANRALYAAKAEGKLTNEQKKSLTEQVAQYREEVFRITFHFVKDNINNPGAWRQLYTCAVAMPEEKQRELFAGANERTAQLPIVVQIKERIRALSNTAVGQPFVDFRMLDPDGREVALSDYVGKGKYVLIDFWASWCKGCIAEIPNIEAAYAKYKNRGLQVVGISFDGSRKAWMDSLKKLNMPWPQMFDGKGWATPAAKLYGLSSIPHIILLDKEGKIIARGIRGEELQGKLAELLK